MDDKTPSYENNHGSSDDFEETCIFCTIANGEDPNTIILAKNEDIVCFMDVNPGAPHHYLVIPKKHIYSCLSLTADHINLVEKMVKMGREVLKANNVTDFEDISLGFHVPPYITVPHLHLHVLAPFSQLFISSKFKYKKNICYLTEKKLLQDLRKKKSDDQKRTIINMCSCVKLWDSEET